MGAWGPGLYANDTTCDVRDTYKGALRDGLDCQQAYEKTMCQFSELIGDDEEPLLWLALAETQWQVGRLMPDVKGKALWWIAQKGGLEPWLESPSKGAGWLKTLDKLRERLESPAPPEKKIRKPAAFETNPWKLNDIYAYRFQGNGPESAPLKGKYIVLQKIGEEVCIQGPMMRLHVFEKIFDAIPTLEDINGVRLLPVDFYSRFAYTEIEVNRNRMLIMNFFMRIYKRSEYPEQNLVYIGNTEGPPNTTSELFIPDREMGWKDFDSWIGRLYEMWKDVGYEHRGDGVYVFPEIPGTHGQDTRGRQPVTKLFSHRARSDII